MKNKEIKLLNVAELNNQLQIERDMLHKFKFANSIASIENPMRIRHTRKTIAKILTELTIKIKRK